MSTDPELESEQRYVDRAYQLLENARRNANRMRSLVEVGSGGTVQARFERDVIYQTVDGRLTDLDLGDASLVFGRIDVAGVEADQVPTPFYIGRVPVSDESHEVVVVDWRAPIAEPFYRATGPNPMGLALRRHFASRGRTLVDIDDELFGVAESDTNSNGNVRGRRALVHALESSRTGRLGDVVGTIQAEQDQIIRSELPGVLVVQGGPGTGKTVVALHRAAYLLYTHRFPLDGQGVLVVGPNRLFLSYIEQVLPSLGEAGVQLAVLADLIDPVSVRGNDVPEVARVKGDPCIARVLARALRDREQPLRSTLRVPHGLQTLLVEPWRSKQIVQAARQRFHRHNAARTFVETSLYEALAASSRTPMTGDVVADRLRDDPRVKAAIEWMWPVLTPAEFLHELFGSKALLRHAAQGVMPSGEADRLYRPWSPHVRDVTWTNQDVPLLDEAATLLGPLPKVKGKRNADGTPKGEIRTWGHIVVDEAQDLSPMQLRMLERRSLNGSMTVVGDIAQATGAWAHEDWHEVLDYLPERRGSRVAQLTIGYRIPGPLMDYAAHLLHRIAPRITPPTSVREHGDAPIVEVVGSGQLAASIARVVQEETVAVGQGNVAVIVPSELVDVVDVALDTHRIDHGSAAANGLSQQVTVVPVRLVKGLEVDSAIVVEPQMIINERDQGLRALYVAFTRATKRLRVLCTDAIPDVLADPATPG